MRLQRSPNRLMFERPSNLGLCSDAGQTSKARSGDATLTCVQALTVAEHRSMLLLGPKLVFAIGHIASCSAFIVNVRSMRQVANTRIEFAKRGVAPSIDSRIVEVGLNCGRGGVPTLDR